MVKVVNISGLIQKLKEIEAIEGDLPVYVFDDIRGPFPLDEDGIVIQRKTNEPKHFQAYWRYPADGIIVLGGEPQVEVTLRFKKCDEEEGL